MHGKIAWHLANTQLTDVDMIPSWRKKGYLGRVFGGRDMLRIWLQRRVELGPVGGRERAFLHREDRSYLIPLINKSVSHLSFRLLFREPALHSLLLFEKLMELSSQTGKGNLWMVVTRYGNPGQISLPAASFNECTKKTSHTEGTDHWRSSILPQDMWEFWGYTVCLELGRMERSLRSLDGWHLISEPWVGFLWEYLIPVAQIFRWRAL